MNVLKLFKFCKNFKSATFLLKTCETMLLNWIGNTKHRLDHPLIRHLSTATEKFIIKQYTTVLYILLANGLFDSLNCRSN